MAEVMPVSHRVVDMLRRLVDAFPKVCVPPQVLEVVVPNAREMSGVSPPDDTTGYVPVTLVTPDPVVVAMTLPVASTAMMVPAAVPSFGRYKSPSVPPAVDAPTTTFPPIEKSEYGVVEPTPTFPFASAENIPAPVLLMRDSTVVVSVDVADTVSVVLVDAVVVPIEVRDPMTAVSGFRI